MWYVKIFLAFILVIAVLLFGFANRSSLATIRWWFGPNAVSEINVGLALFFAYALGVLTFFLISVWRELRLRHRYGQATRETDRMRRELDALRTAALEGPLAGGGESATPDNLGGETQRTPGD